MKATTMMMPLLIAGSLAFAALPASASNELRAEQGSAKMQQQRGNKRWHHGAERHGLQQLALTDEQKQQLQQLKREMRAKAGDRAEQREQRQQLQQLVQADSFDATAARLLLEQRQQAQLDRQLAMLEYRHQLWQLLTPEQREQLQQQRSESKPRQRGGRKASLQA